MTSATSSSSVARPVRLGVRARRLLSVFLLLHGLAHLAGTSDVFAKAAGGEYVDYLAGGWSVSDPTLLRLFGALWAAVAVGFVVSAALTWAASSAWPQVLCWVTLVSLALVVAALWTSVIGVVIDVVLLAVAWRAGALTRRASG